MNKDAEVVTLARVLDMPVLQDCLEDRVSGHDPQTVRQPHLDVPRPRHLAYKEMERFAEKCLAAKDSRGFFYGLTSSLPSIVLL